MRAAHLLALPFTALCLALTACPAPTTKPPPGTTDNANIDVTTLAPSTRADLVWRRGKALQQGLADALLLPTDGVCVELDRYSCVDRVHQVALGGNDPFGLALYEPLAQPGATTTIGFDRTVLAACDTAVEADKARAAVAVFLGVDLSAASLDKNNVKTLDDAKFMVTTLYQRLLARDPLTSEVDTVLTLLDEPISGTDFAKLACFSIASTTETLFY
jgi:hypothetical protein